MSGLTDAERRELVDLIEEWRRTCRQMGVPFTPASIAEWIIDSAEWPRQIVQQRVDAALAPIERFADLLQEAGRTRTRRSWADTATDLRAAIRYARGGGS